MPIITNPSSGGGGGTQQWFAGTGAPDVSLGADGDYYGDNSNNDLYLKTSGSWNIVVNMQGVPAGGTTGQVLAKNSNTNYDDVWITPTGLTDWVETQSTAAPNNVISVSAFTPVDAGSGAADAAILPLGGGALLANIPDGTTTGGNKRGAAAVDWQSNRSSETDVAAASFSIICGGISNKITSDSDRAVVGGGGVNIITSSQDALIGSGSNNSVTNANFGVVGGGTQNAVTELGGAILGGSHGTTRGTEWSEAYGANIFSGLGQSQRRASILGASTTNATPAVMSTDLGGAASYNQITLPASSTYAFSGAVVALSAATGDSASFAFSGLIKRGALVGSTALVAAVFPVAIQDVSLASTSVSITADTTLGALNVSVTGVAATIIQWVCHIDTVETTL